MINNKKTKWNFKASYSNFLSVINDSSFYENNFIAKTDYIFEPFNFIKVTGLYELSTGKEAFREFRYVKVNPGLGSYSWIDYNNNNLEEYNEFELSHFSDTADYMRISFPTNNYFDVKNTRISQ